MSSPANAARPPALVELAGVRKVYRHRGLEEPALRSVSLTVAAGEYVCVEGPSGAGKSTLLAIVGLLDTPTAGEYRLGGRRVDTLPADERSVLRNREIGLVFQNFNLIGTLTARENVELPLAYRGMRASERRFRVKEILEQLDLAAHADRYPEELSGGEQQRVAVARALVGRPPLILADEPTGNLDGPNGAAIMRILAELNQAGSTVVLVTHDPRFAIEASRTVHLADGMLAAGDGTVA
jgi:putative ABC transport system ATP-binding protein